MVKPLHTSVRRLAFLFAACLSSVLSNSKAEPLLLPRPAAGLNESGVPDYVFISGRSIGLSENPTELKRLPDGRLLAVGYGELAMGDGFRWEIFQQEPDDTRQRVQNVAVDAQGRIHAGLPGKICEVEFLESGRWRFREAVSINSLLGPESPAPVNVAEVDDNWFWWWGSGPIIRWRPGGEARIVGTANAPQNFFSVNGRSMYSDFSNGSLSEFKDSEFRPLAKTSRRYVEQTVTATVNLDARRTLAGTLGLGVQIIEGNERSPFAYQGPLGPGSRINDIVAIGTGVFAAAVENYGVVFFNGNAEILQVLPRTLSHRFSRVTQLLPPKENGVVWAVIKEGFIGIRFPGSISHFEPLIPTGMDYTQPYRFDGRLWLMSNGEALQGLYDESGNLHGFEPDSPQGYMSGLAQIGSRIVAGTRSGIFVREAPREWRALATDVDSPNFSDRPYQEAHWLFAAENKVGWVHDEKGRLSVEAFEEPALGHAYRVETDGEGTLWVELGNGRIASVKPRLPRPEVRLFEGVGNSWARVFILEGKARVMVGSALLALNEANGRWEPDVEVVRSHPSLEGATGRPALDAQGRLWTTRKEGIHVSTTSAAPSDLDSAPPEPQYFTPQEDGVVWIHQRGSLARYDSRVAAQKPVPKRALITKVSTPTTGRTLYVGGNPLLELGPDENTIAVHFVCPNADVLQPVSFEFLIDPSSRKWSTAGTQGVALFNQLSPGDYTLRVRALSAQVAGPESVLKIRIQRPWYRTPAAYVGFSLVLATLVVVSIILPINLQRRRKRQLELEVKERTFQLEHSEKRYRELNHELELRVEQRTEELRLRIREAEELNQTLDRSAAELSDANIRLTSTNKELESFSYSVSHDLRAPLRSIDGFSKAIEEDYGHLLDEEGRQYLSRIRHGAQRMGALIDDLLKLARISRAEIKRETVDLSAIAAGIHNHLHNTEPERVVDFFYHPNLQVTGDQRLIQIALENLLENAWKYTRKRAVSRIEFGQISELGHPGYGMFFVKDNGAGFEMRYADKLFTAFNRLHGPTEFEGTGIGLATVNRIIARHGGHIFADAEVGRGATFYFTFSPNRPAPQLPGTQP